MNGGGIRRIVLVVRILIAVEPVEAVFGSEPHEAPATFQDRAYMALRQPLLRGEPSETGCKLLRNNILKA
ncbi:hypothetical protein D3C86_2104210 [compost metagenome]